ncbi:hypothetical protein HCN44_010921 [Aphidius gifuensis]|uniref:Uncharacterized protein n=1 Tax=Aphidius gifuensis TaxID=684658 RepID=A0A834Y7B2_APHGI|nr:hypothetical protein HCN44_010921 [Aphidius gifuensis]
MKIENIIAIGTDGGSNLCGINKSGINKSLFTLLRNDNKNLMLMKCTCHSLNKCCSDSSKLIPADVEYLVRELYNYFSVSTLRNVVGLWKLLAVAKLLDQWVELESYFSFASTDKNDIKARQIYEKIVDPVNLLLYLKFLKPILQEMNTSNLIFQDDKVDVGSAYEKMYTLFLMFPGKIFKQQFLIKADTYKSLFSQLINAATNDLAYKPAAEIDLGHSLSTELK